MFVFFSDPWSCFVHVLDFKKSKSYNFLHRDECWWVWGHFVYWYQWHQKPWKTKVFIPKTPWSQVAKPWFFDGFGCLWLRDVALSSRPLSAEARAVADRLPDDRPAFFWWSHLSRGATVFGGERAGGIMGFNGWPVEGKIWGWKLKHSKFLMQSEPIMLYCYNTTIQLQYNSISMCIYFTHFLQINTHFENLSYCPLALGHRSHGLDRWHRSGGRVELSDRGTPYGLEFLTTQKPSKQKSK